MTRTPPLYALARRTVGHYLTRRWRPTVTGVGHLPGTGGAILAANHLSVADQLFLGIVAPRHIAFWAKAEYFRSPGVRGYLTRRVVTAMGAIPVERGDGRAALSAFDAAVPVLRSGGLVAVFPEGTRSPDGRLYRGRTGVVRLAHQAGVPIIPVGIRGTDDLRPPGARLPRRHPVSIAFGPAIPVRVEAPADVRRVTDAVMAAIQSLSEQEYVPRYARAPQQSQGPRPRGRSPDAGDIPVDIRPGQEVLLPFSRGSPGTSPMTRRRARATRRGGGRLRALLTRRAVVLPLALLVLATAASCDKRHTPASVPVSTAPSIVYRLGRTLMLAGRPYRFLGFNAFGMEGCETGKPWTRAQLDAYFSALPPDAMTRTWAFQPWGMDALDQIVASATAHRQRLILSLADGASDCETDGAPLDSTGAKEQGHGKVADWYLSGYRTTYLPWLREVVSRYAHSPAIGMWEIMNEPGTHVDLQPTAMKAFLDVAAATIKSIDPHHLVETGALADYVPSTADYQLIDSGPDIDVGSIHEYDYDYQQSNTIVSTHLASALWAVSDEDKPLIVGETGVLSGPSGCRTSLARRSDVDRRKLDGYLQAGVAGVLLWNYAISPTRAPSCSYSIGPHDPVLTMIRNYRATN